MIKPYGFRGAIVPYSVSDKLTDSFIIDGVEVTVKDGIFEVGYDTANQENTARDIAHNLLNSWRQRNNIKVTVEFNHSWHPRKVGQDHSITLSETIHVSERVTTSVVIKGIAYIIKPHSDSYSFTNDISIARKALKDKTLADALHYYGEEVVDDKRPLYGIYKAIEVITKHLGKDGRAKLGKMASKKEKYVTDVMQTAQIQRHSNTSGTRLISDQECKERASILISAYTDSIVI